MSYKSYEIKVRKFPGSDRTYDATLYETDSDSKEKTVFEWGRGYSREGALKSLILVLKDRIRDQ